MLSIKLQVLIKVKLQKYILCCWCDFYILQAQELVEFGNTFDDGLVEKISKLYQNGVVIFISSINENSRTSELGKVWFEYRDRVKNIVNFGFRRKIGVMISNLNTSNIGTTRQQYQNCFKKNYKTFDKDANESQKEILKQKKYVVFSWSNTNTTINALDLFVWL